MNVVKYRCFGLYLLARTNLAQVKFKFLALQDVPISTSGLPRAAGDDGVETTSTKLVLQVRVNLGQGATFLQFSLNRTRLFLGSCRGGLSVRRLSGFG